MRFTDIIKLALRNLREAKLRVALTTMGVVIGVAVIVTMVSFGLGLQRNTVERFKQLDLFNEVTVYGRSLSGLVAEFSKRGGGGRNAQASNGGEAKRERNTGKRERTERNLDDAAVEEIARIPGVAYVEPHVSFVTFVRSNGYTRQLTVGGVRVPNEASRFNNYAAGKMIAAPDADEVIVDAAFLNDFGFAQASDAIGKAVEVLSPPERENQAGAQTATDDKNEAGAGDDFSFFGLPLEGTEDETAASNEPGTAGLVARTFRIAGVLKDEVEKAPSSRARFRGLMPVSSLYVPLAFARDWKATHRNTLDEVALQLARQSGVLGPGEGEGYESATVRVNDVVAVAGVQKRLDEMGFNTFNLLSQLDEMRTIFLVINSALGLLGGISLLVASFGIANTMIMSIFERTREIGIMKAIGAEDREIKLIFFVEAAVIGLTGGIVGALAAWGIDQLANQLAYRFILQPNGSSFVDFFSLPPYLWLGAILFAMLVAILAALYPASRAARIDPVKALRHD